jgi:hypothetical protein
MSAKLHATVVLSSVKDPAIPLDRKMGGSQGHCEEENILGIYVLFEVSMNEYGWTY